MCKQSKLHLMYRHSHFTVFFFSLRKLIQTEILPQITEKKVTACKCRDMYPHSLTKLMSTGSFRELFREVPVMLNYPFILSTLQNLMYK